MAAETHETVEQLLGQLAATLRRSDPSTPEGHARTERLENPADHAALVPLDGLRDAGLRAKDVVTGLMAHGVSRDHAEREVARLSA
jgi:hypothetical protein